LYFCFNTPPTTDFSTLSLHDALPICSLQGRTSFAGTAILFTFGMESHAASLAPALRHCSRTQHPGFPGIRRRVPKACRSKNNFGDRKSTRLNSSHLVISYAVFCLKKK